MGIDEQQKLAILSKLQELKIPVQYEVSPNEGHSLGRSESRERVFEGTIKFLDSLVTEKR